jgi:hypothetical protein
MTLVIFTTALCFDMRVTFCFVFSPIIYLAARVADGMDFSVNPCDNFYEYACGGWMKSHVIPSDRSYLATFSVLRDTSQVILKRKCIGILFLAMI